MRKLLGLTVVGFIFVGCPGGGGGDGETETETGGEATEAEATETESETGSGGGEACEDDSDCTSLGPNFGCFDSPDGECACEPGFVLCGTECVDLRTDSAHCGACDAPCGSCVEGWCGTPPGAGTSPVFTVSGGDGATQCLDSVEAKPERSINGPSGDAEFIVAYSSGVDLANPSNNRNNWADASGTWSSGIHTTPSSSLDLRPTNDSWVATHGGTGLEYSVSVATGAGPLCTATAVTDRSRIQANTWEDSGYECVSTHDGTIAQDGPAIESDLGDESIYIAYLALDGFTPQGGPHLLRYHPCTGGELGSATCPLDWADEPFFIGPRGHVNVVVNPCTHRPIILYRTETTVTYRVYSLDGQMSVAGILDADAQWEGNSNCNGSACTQGEVCRCGAGTSDCNDQAALDSACMNVTQRPRASTWYNPDTGQCTMYLAYDVAVDVPPSDDSYIKSRFRAFDITTDNVPPTPIPALDFDSDPTTTQNEFNTVLQMNPFDGSYGVFYYEQLGGDECETVFTGATAPHGQPLVPLAAPLSGPFPTTNFPLTGGLSHYVAGMDFNRPGSLTPSWSEPVPTTASCIECESQQYSLVVNAAEVRP